MSCAAQVVSVALAGLVLLPCAASAQSGIAGVVRDTTGAVLPGVTVEATSDALIEKTRTVATDVAGQFRVVDLRPGVYAVTFTLAGFNSLKRDGIELTAGFTATVNAEMDFTWELARQVAPREVAIKYTRKGKRGGGLARIKDERKIPDTLGGE